MAEFRKVTISWKQEKDKVFKLTFPDILLASLAWVGVLVR